MLLGFLGEVLPYPHRFGLVVGVELYFIELFNWVHVSLLFPNPRIEVFDLSYLCCCSCFFSLELNNEYKSLGRYLPLPWIEML